MRVIPLLVLMVGLACSPALAEEPSPVPQVGESSLPLADPGQPSWFRSEERSAWFLGLDITWARPSFTPRFIGVDPTDTLLLQQTLVPRISLGIPRDPANWWPGSIYWFFNFEAVHSDGNSWRALPGQLPARIQGRLDAQTLEWEWFSLTNHFPERTPEEEVFAAKFGLRFFCEQSVTDATQPDLAQYQRDDFIGMGPYLGGDVRLPVGIAGLGVFVGVDFGLLFGVSQQQRRFSVFRALPFEDSTSKGILLGTFRAEAGLSWDAEWKRCWCRLAVGYRFDARLHLGETIRGVNIELTPEEGIPIVFPDFDTDRKVMRDLLYYGPFAQLEIRY